MGPGRRVRDIKVAAHMGPLLSRYLLSRDQRERLPSGFDQTAPGQIMLAIDGTRFLAVQVAAVASERNQVDHRNVVDSVSTAPYGRGSAWRTTS